MLFAFSKLAITPVAPDGGEAPVIGYDLDGLCTGLEPPNNGAPCAAPEGGTTPTDKAGGVDNSFQSAFEKFFLFSSDPNDKGASSFNKAIRAGQQTTLLALIDYNGEANDSVVKISLTPSAGLQSPGDGGDGGPSWDGQDRWTYVSEAAFIGDVPVPLSTGYVANDVLVVNFAELKLAFGEFALTLHDAVVTATIAREGTVRSLHNGTIAGRAGANDLIRATGPVLVQDVATCLNDSGLPKIVRDGRFLVDRHGVVRRELT